jgi:hypothetical protein
MECGFPLIYADLMAEMVEGYCGRNPSLLMPESEFVSDLVGGHHLSYLSCIVVAARRVSPEAPRSYQPRDLSINICTMASATCRS